MIERTTIGHRGSGGRPSKGSRKARTIRFPQSLNTMIEKAAAAAGYDNVNDYVVDLVAQAHAEGVHPKPASGQERLPISA